MNAGKKFERDWKKSCLGIEGLFYYRNNDGTASWGNGSDSVRFQTKNICDVFMYKYPVFFALELKSHKGSSVPFSAIRKDQKEGLIRESDKKGVVSGLLLFFSDKELCYFLDIKDYKYLEDAGKRKSIPISYCQEKGIKIDCQKIRTTYKYNSEDFVRRMINDIG